MSNVICCDRCGAPIPNPLDQYGRPAVCIKCWYDPPADDKPEPPQPMTWQLWFGATIEIVEDEE